ncbi:EAL domain-containing protein [Neptuniibacter sp. QD48_11]|uniref:EAL domain-containing protein n=1 Tax=unclassified Neptuniibacter TaxID=2630693 RepID=UPI0039F5E03B
MSDELIVFAEEEKNDSTLAATNNSSRPWKVLVVDDDKDVHEVTKFGLKGLVFLGQPLELLHAYSAKEAQETLSNNDDIAVILLDVVMETESAGLDLVKTIREELALTNTRIILRTGQPGYAPEIEVILKYDINDYKNKADLTRTRLYTSVTAAIRSYSEITAIDSSRKGLERIVHASSELMSLHGIRELANGIICQLAALLGISEEGMICFKKNSDDEVNANGSEFTIVAASAQPSNQKEFPEVIEDANINAMLLEASSKRRSIENDYACVLYFPSEFRNDMLLYLDIQRPLEGTEHQLLEVFCSNISVCLDNATILDRLHNYAYFDSLLNIPNRVSFANQIDKIMLRQLHPQLITLIDIDHFSGMNDTLGSESGDELLKLVANRLAANLPKDSFICRISGDTFGVMGPEDSFTVEQINAMLTKPFELFGDDLTISITQGCYILKDANISGNNAIKRANIALKRAKDIARGEHVEYTHEIERETQQRMLLLQGLRKAYSEGELFLAYQPQIDLRTGRITGFEALIRWRTKSGALISPVEFIPVAESSGLIVPIGEWVMDTAMRDLETVEQKYGLGLQVGINISPAQFRHPDFLKLIQNKLDNFSLKPQQVEFEVTESVAMIDTDSVRDILQVIHDLGAKVAIDDFGTGFSCLSYLETLNFDRLKIDKSFIDKMLDKQKGTHIPEMIINLGSDLDMAVIAEGVETVEQVERLKELKCFEVQGYHYAKPMELEQLYVWLDEHLSQ